MNIRKGKKLYVMLVIMLVFTSIMNRQLVPTGLDYLIYMLLLFSFFSKHISGRFLVPQKYLRWFLLLLILIVLNTLISVYVPTGVYVVYGTFFSILPFVHFLLSYNYLFESQEIDSFIDLLIKSILIAGGIVWIESLFFPVDGTVGNFLGSNLFMVGFFASLCNQGLILSLAQYLRYRRRLYMKYALFLILTVVLTFQLKAMAGMLFVIAGFYFMTMRNKAKALMLSVSILLIALPIALSVPALKQKIEKYIELYDFSDANSGIARVALYYTSFKIAGDYFPFGTGQGTFGSIPVNMVGSDVYSDYDIDYVYGLAEKDKVDFKMDTHWSSVLGEMGIAGMICYLALMTFPFRRYRGRYFRQTIRKDYLFIILFSPLVMMLESLFLPLPNRFAFIVIYSGLVAIIFRYEVERLKRGERDLLNC